MQVLTLKELLNYFSKKSVHFFLKLISSLHTEDLLGQNHQTFYTIALYITIQYLFLDGLEIRSTKLDFLA